MFPNICISDVMYYNNWKEMYSSILFYFKVQMTILSNFYFMYLDRYSQFSKFDRAAVDSSYN